MLHLKYRFALLSSGALLLLAALNAPASAAPPLPTLGPPRTPVLQIQTWRNPAFNPQGMMPGSDPRTWSPYPLRPTPWNPNNAMPGSDPRTWSPYPLYPPPPPPPSPWIPPYRPYDPPPYPAPYGPIYPGVIGNSVIW